MDEDLDIDGGGGTGGGNNGGNGGNDGTPTPTPFIEPYISAVDPYRQSPNGNIPIPIKIYGNGFPVPNLLSLTFGDTISISDVRVYKGGLLLEDENNWGDEIRCNIFIPNSAPSGTRTIVIRNTQTGQFASLQNVFEVVNAGSTGIDWALLGGRKLSANILSNSNLLQGADVFINDSSSPVGKTTFSQEFSYEQLLGGVKVTSKKSGWVSNDYFILKLEPRHRLNNNLVNPPLDGLQYEQVQGITTEDITFLLYVTRYDAKTNTPYNTYEYWDPNTAVLNFELEETEIFTLNLTNYSTTFDGNGGTKEFSTIASNQNISWNITSNQNWATVTIKEKPSGGGTGGSGGGGGGTGGGGGGIGGSDGSLIGVASSIENQSGVGSADIIITTSPYTNQNNVNRTAVITITPSGEYVNQPNLQPRTYIVTQTPTVPEEPITFTLNRFEEGFGPAGGETTFKVISSNETVTWVVNEVTEKTSPFTKAFTSQNILGDGQGKGSKDVKITVYENTQFDLPSTTKNTRIVITPTGEWANKLQSLVFNISQFLDSLPEQPFIVDAVFRDEPQALTTSRDIEVNTDGVIRPNQNIKSISIRVSKSQVENPNPPVDLTFTAVTSLGNGDPANLKPDHFTITKILYSANGAPQNTSSIFNVSYPLGIRAIPLEYTGPFGIWDYLKNTVTAEIHIHYRNGDTPQQRQILTYTLNPKVLGEFNFTVTPPTQIIYANADGTINSSQLTPYKVEGTDSNGNKMVYSDTSAGLQPLQYWISPTEIRFFDSNGNQINISNYSQKIEDKVGGIYINESKIPIPVPVLIRGTSNVIYKEANGGTTGKTVTFELNVRQKEEEPPPKELKLTLSKYTEIIGFEATNTSFDVIANDQNITWELTSDSSWITATPTNPIKKGNNTIQVSALKNPGEERVGLITITATNEYKALGSLTYRLTQIGAEIDEPPPPPPDVVVSTFDITPKEISITVLEENSRIIAPSIIPLLSTSGKQRITNATTGVDVTKNYVYNPNLIQSSIGQYRITNISGVPVDNTKPLSSVFETRFGGILTSSLTGTVSIEYIDNNGKRGSTTLNFFIKRVISPKSLIQSDITPITQNTTVNISNEIITPLTDYKLYVEEVHEFGKNKLNYSTSKVNSTYYISKVEIFDTSTNSITGGLVGIPNTNEEIILFGNLVPGRLNVMVHIDFVDRYGNTGKRIVPAYISRDVLPPQLTLVEWPQFINGADYKGYDQPFNVRFTSENAFNVKIYISNIAENRFYEQYSPNDIASFNVQDLVNRYSLPTADGDTFSFDLVLVPIRGDVIGKEEVVTVTYDASDLQIPRPIIVNNFERVIETTFDFDIYRDEVAKYLTHFINFDDREPILISNWERDDITFSEFEEDELGNQILVKENPTLILKLYEPLPENIQPRTSIWITKQRS